MNRARLTWAKQTGDSWYAYRGRHVVGMVGKMKTEEEAGLWYYKLDAVSTKWITKGSGHRSTLEGAKESVNRAWQIWLQHHDLRGNEDA